MAYDLLQFVYLITVAVVARVSGIALALLATASLIVADYFFATFRSAAGVDPAGILFRLLLLGTAGVGISALAAASRSARRAATSAGSRARALEEQLAEARRREESAREAARSAEARLHVSLVAAGATAWELDLDSGLLRHTAGVPFLTPRENLQEFLKAVHPDDRSRVEAAVERARRTGEYQADYRIEADGRLLWLADRGHAAAGASGGSRIQGITLDLTATRESAEALRLTEQRFRQALASLPAAVFQQDRELRCTWLYQPRSDLHHNHELGKRDAESFERPEDAAITETLKRRVMQTRRGERQEIVIHHHGQPRTYDLMVEPLMDANDAVIGVNCTTFDVTERVEFERALAASEQRYRTLVEATSQLIFTVDRIGRMVTEQPNWAALSGQTFDEYKGFGWTRIIHQEDLPAAQAAWLDARQNRTPCTTTVRLRRSDGEYRVHLLRAVPVPDPDGRVREWITAGTDVTVQHQAQKAREASEARLMLAELAGGFAAWELNLETLRLEHSAEFPRLWGLGPDEVTWEDALRRIVPADREHVQRALQMAPSTGRFEADFCIAPEGGCVRWLAVRARTFQDAPGAPLRLIGVSFEITDRKAAEEQARQALARAEFHFANSPLVVIEWDSQFRVRRWAGQAARLFGWAEDEVIGLHPGDWTFVHDEDAPEVEAWMRRLTTGEEVRNVHSHRNYTKDGRILHCRWYNSAFLDENGNLNSLLSIVEDVTERMRAEADQRFRIQLGLDLAHVADRQQLAETATRLLAERIDANRCFLAEFHPETNTATIANDYAKGSHSLRGEWDLNMHSAMIAQARAARIVVVNDVANSSLSPSLARRYARADIQAFVSVPLGRAGQWAASLMVTSARPRVWTEREVALVHAVAERLWPALETARLIAELQMREQYFRKLADTIPDIVWTADATGAVDYYNGRWTDFTGRSVQEAFGAEWAKLVHPDDLPAVREAWSKAVASGRSYEVEARLMHHTGRWRWIVARAAPLLDADGRVLRWFGTNTDIDDSKRSAEALRMANRLLKQSNDELKQYAWAASHDLQEPLRMVVTFSQLLVRRYGEQLGEEANELLAFTVEGALRMERLLNDLKEYWLVSDPGLGQFENVDLNEVFGSALANLEPAVSESGAVITSDVLPTVFAERTPITLLLQNLLSNAIKYRYPQKSPVVHLEARRVANEHWISVRDNGIGIAPEYHERIFGLFKRLHTRQQYAGSGIGLALCRKIVERHNGRLTVESEPGKGSVFTFVIPDVDERPRA